MEIVVKQEHELAFQQASGALGISATLAESALEKLQAAYRENHRFYHNLDHIQWMLDRLAETEGAENSFLVLAVWFHDAVYDPRSKTNEADSAALVGEWLPELNSDDREKLDHLILGTAHGSPRTMDVESDLLCDVDLSILGTEEVRYREYSEAVRKEYSFVPREDYRKGRAAVLQSFLDQDQIFQTAHFAGWEQRARDNLQREMNRLF